MNSDYFCLFGSVYDFIYQQAIPPRELRMRNANPRPAGEAEELELELIQTQMAQKPMLRAEVGMRVRCANKASAE